MVDGFRAPIPFGAGSYPVALARTDDKPPSTPMTWPVTQPLAGFSSQQIGSATSSGEPSRPRGCIAIEAFREEVRNHPKDVDARLALADALTHNELPCFPRL